MGVATEVRGRPAAGYHVDAFDGVRAVAILMVFCFHLHLMPLPFRSAGYLGVDVFFVLSGFLITSLLLAEHSRTGRVSLRGFYLRRALRLGPVMLVLLAAGVVVFVFAPSSYGYRPHPVAFVALLTAWMNWLVIWRRDAGGMFQHAWSLAIELQFYVVYPVLLVASWRLGLRLRSIAVLLGVVTIAAVGWRISIWHGVPAVIGHGDPAVRFTNGALIGNAWSRSYFGTFSRVDGLLVGALAAIFVSGARRRAWMVHRPHLLRVAIALGVLTVVAVVVRSDTTTVGAFVPVYGLLPLEIGVAAVLVGLLLLPQSVAARALGLSPLVWIGRRSYAMYMLHIPVWMAVAHFELGRRLLPSSPRAATGWISVALTFLVAELSFRLVEKPALALKARFAAPG